MYSPPRAIHSPTRRVRACGIDDVPAEHPLQVTLDGNDIVLCRAYGALWACAGVCTHAGGDLGDGHMADNAIVCPLHGAKFDPRTGAVLRGPATEPIATHTVLIEGADVFVELPWPLAPIGKQGRDHLDESRKSRA